MLARPRLLAAIIDADFTNSALCGVKVHFGEKGNHTFIPAEYAKVAVRFLTERGARPFLFETNTLYYGERGNTVSHLNLAAEHGFSPDKIGAPVVIADGMRGEAEARVPVKGRHYRTAQLAALVPEIPVVLGLSHFKGHMLSGFGASVKNFSMGCAARGGKLAMHSLSKPSIDVSRCTRCGVCETRCPVGAITRRNGDFFIVEAKCTGCAGCIGVCPVNAVRIRWDEAAESASEKMAEYAMAALAGKEAFYVNFLVNITPECDCWGEKMSFIKDDVGVLASRDPVALDQASFDMVSKEIRSAHPEVDPEIQLAHAERIGLGMRKYELEEL